MHHHISHIEHDFRGHKSAQSLFQFLLASPLIIMKFGRKRRNDQSLEFLSHLLAKKQEWNKEDTVNTVT